MTKKSGSKTSQTKSKAARNRGDVESAKLMLAHVRGEIDLPSYTLPGPVDVKAIREKSGMSQAEFAATFALSRRTLQEWEQGRVAPDGAVRAYLRVIERNPEAVREALK